MLLKDINSQLWINSKITIIVILNFGQLRGSYYIFNLHSYTFCVINNIQKCPYKTKTLLLQKTS